MTEKQKQIMDEISRHGNHFESSQIRIFNTTLASFLCLAEAIYNKHYPDDKKEFINAEAYSGYGHMSEKKQNEMKNEYSAWGKK